MSFGRESKAGFNSKGVSIICFIIRILMGGMMLEEGLGKLIGGTFSAAGYLANSIGPFSGWYASLIPQVPLLNIIVTWAQILIGLALLLGVLVRLASLGAAIMMMLFYLAYIPSPLGWLNYQLIYTVLFIGNIFTGAGYFLGLDGLLYKFEEKKHPLRFLFG
jgi:thiosulfate dehydrogenase [quinone] large subunit